ncbi:MAG: rhomboid family intramembrane serine protease [Planctomycetes bacterium]|nr:rhomboid family intramembrane serine protease [Planctomycetota bacterium]
MLLPIGTDVQLRKHPSVTYLLIGVNMLLFAVSWSVGRVSGDTSTGGMIGEVQSILNACELSNAHFHIWSLFTYQFMHASWWHVIGNMIFLLPFGKVVEDRLGHFGFLALFLGTGAIGGGLHLMFYDNPVIGASGSVCAITAAFAVLAPRSKIRILFVFFLITIIEVPGLLLVIFQIAFDALNLIGSIAGADGGPTAWVVHLGGYASGFVIVYLLLVTGLIARGEYDLFRVITQANRRRQFRAVVSDSHAPKKEMQKPLSQVQIARASIAQSIASGQHQVAANEYLETLSNNPRFTLDSKTRVEVANTLLRSKNIAEAATLYEQHLNQKSPPDDAPDVALLLAAKYARNLDNTKRSKKLLDQFYDQFSAEHKNLADLLRNEMAKA